MKKNTNFNDYKSIKINVGSHKYSKFKYYTITKVTSNRIFLNGDYYFQKKDLNCSKVTLLKTDKGKDKPKKYFESQYKAHIDWRDNTNLYNAVPTMRKEENGK